MRWTARIQSGNGGSAKCAPWTLVDMTPATVWPEAPPIVNGANPRASSNSINVSSTMPASTWIR